MSGMPTRPAESLTSTQTRLSGPFRARSWRNAVQTRQQSTVVSTKRRATLQNLVLALLGRRDEQDVIAGRLGTAAKVLGIRSKLPVKAFCLFTSTIQLEMKEQLALTDEKPAPSIGHRARLLPVRAPDAMLADPVIKAQRRYVSRGHREIDKQLIGFQIVHEVVMAREGVLCPLDIRPRFVFGQACKLRGATAAE